MGRTAPVSSDSLLDHVQPRPSCAGGRASQGWPIRLICLPISPLGPSAAGPPPLRRFAIHVDLMDQFPAWRIVRVMVVVVVAVVVVAITLADVLTSRTSSPGNLPLPSTIMAG